MRPKVTIVIPFYNCAYVDQALQSALEQTYGPLEIIVVDDGSTEHVDMLQAYLPYIHYLGKSNGGTASALNHGIRHASGDYIAWLSSDDTYHRDKINNQVSFMVENGAYISHTNFNFINQYSQVTSYQAAAVFPSMTEFYRFFNKEIRSMDARLCLKRSCLHISVCLMNCCRTHMIWICGTA